MIGTPTVAVVTDPGTVIAVVTAASAPASLANTARPATLSANAAIPRVMVDNDFDIFSPICPDEELQVRVGLVAEKFEAAFAESFSLRLPKPDKYFSSVHSRTSPQNFFIGRREQPETWLPTSFYYCFKH